MTDNNEFVPNLLIEVWSDIKNVENASATVLQESLLSYLKEIVSLRQQVNTLTQFLVDFRERTPYGLYQEQIDTVLQSLESPREEQTE